MALHFEMDFLKNAEYGFILAPKICNQTNHDACPN
jgi:hypothetical protein